METNWTILGANGIFAVSLAAAVLTGVLISLIMDFSAGPHREPFWLPGLISAGSGATITTVVYILHEAFGLSIWQVMALGAGCGALGVLGYSLSVTLLEKLAQPGATPAGNSVLASRSPANFGGCPAMASTRFSQNPISNRKETRLLAGRTKSNNEIK